MAIRAVLFDLDDTLWRIGPPPDWDRITVLQSDEIAPVCTALALGRLDRMEFIRSFWADFNSLYTKANALLEEVDGPAILRQSLGRYEFDCSPADAVALWEGLHNVPFRHFNISPFADAASTVMALRDAGFRLAIVTNRPLTSPMLVRHIEDQGLPDVFEAIVTTGDVGYQKPHPAVFEAALARLDARPDEAVVIGDSYEKDVVPAANLGALAVLKLNDRAPDAAWRLAHHRVPTLASLLELDIFER